jgi:hypothetical protein
MFGTELDTAYFNPTPPTQQHVMDSVQKPTIKIPEHENHQQESLKFETQMPIVPVQQNDNIIKELQNELEKQKTLNKRETEPLFDRFVSKKKDVMKLLNIALTVLLAISLHFVFSDLLKTYLQNNDFSSNKETLIKFIYPACVLLVLWSFKVFNK